jgi:hypothetical protein
VNHFLEILLRMLAFSFCFWVTGEPVRTLRGDFSLPLMVLRLVTLVGVFAENTYVGVDGRTDAGVKARHFNTFFNT